MSKDAVPKAESHTLPQLPPGWCWTKINEVGEVKLGRQRSPEHHAGTHMRPYLRVANVFEDRIDLSDVLEMNFTPQEYEIFRLKFGDILLNEGQSLHLVGRPALYRDELPGACFQNTLVRFRAGEAVLPEFALLIFLHYLHAKRFQKLARWTVNIAHLGRTRFAEVEFPLPPLAEQRRIVDRCGELLSDLDAGVAALERARANLKKYRAAVLKAAVTGDLTADWRATHPQVEPASKLLDRILAERRRKWEVDQQAKFSASRKTPPKDWQEKYSLPRSPDTDGLPALPPSWCWAGFEQCAFEVTVGHVGPMKDRYVDTGFPFLRSQNVRPLRFDRDGLKFIPADFHGQLAKSRLVGGELLVVRSGNIGEACVYPETGPEANCADLVITRLAPGVMPAFAAIFVNSPFGRYLVGGRRTGSALSHFNVGAMESSPFPLPPLREQEEIVAEVERQLSDCSATGNYIAASLKRADRLRQSILKDAFAGRLVPQDPNDEPATALLDRIRQARGPAAVARLRGRRKQVEQPDTAE